MPQTWYGLKELLTILDMDRRTFSRNVAAGLFPVGLVRPGEKRPKWDSKDLEFMQYLLTRSERLKKGGRP